MGLDLAAVPLPALLVGATLLALAALVVLRLLSNTFSGKAPPVEEGIPFVGGLIKFTTVRERGVGGGWARCRRRARRHAGGERGGRTQPQRLGAALQGGCSGHPLHSLRCCPRARVCQVGGGGRAADLALAAAAAHAPAARAPTLPPRCASQGPLPLMTEMYAKHGEVFTVPLLHKRMTFLVGPHSAPHFFNANDEKMSQTEVRLWPDVWVCVWVSECVSGHGCVCGCVDGRAIDAPALRPRPHDRPPPPHAAPRPPQVYSFNIPTFGKGVVYDVDHKVRVCVGG